MPASWPQIQKRGGARKENCEPRARAVWNGTRPRRMAPPSQALLRAALLACDERLGAVERAAFSGFPALAVALLPCLEAKLAAEVETPALVRLADFGAFLVAGVRLVLALRTHRIRSDPRATIEIGE